MYDNRNPRKRWPLPLNSDFNIECETPEELEGLLELGEVLELW